MVLVLSTAAKNAQVDAVVDLLDADVGNPNGQLIFRTSGDVEVATTDYANPAYGASAAGVATANAITADASATGGVMAKYTSEDRANTEVFEGTVTGIGGGGDMEATSTTVVATEEVSVPSQTFGSGN